MKQSVMLFSIVLASLFVFVSCNLISELQSGNPLIFKASLSNKTNLNDTILFTGKSIRYFNSTTGEVSFLDSIIAKRINSFHWIKCYLETDSLFTATVTSDIMSSVVNDLVLNHNLRDGKFYFQDGYPAYIDNLGTNGIRIQNKEKRAVAWSRFIEQLKKEGKYKEN